MDLITDHNVLTRAIPELAAGPDWRLGRFPNLMPRRIERILLVSSAYDSFILEEDGLLTEMIYSEYTDLGLSHAPGVSRVSTGEEALAAIRSENYDLVITMVRLVDMDLSRFGAAAKQIRPDLPIVILSGRVRPEDAAAARQLGADVLLKPYSTQELAQVLRRRLPQQTPR